MTVVTRIAPSPTGDPHVGTAYIALVNLAVARQSGGRFILRIEDTDRVRSTRDSEEAILNSLRWLGLDWDEGPDVGGPAGPYRQSERGAIYAEHCDRLLETGHAFRCFCTPERLSAVRETQRAEGKAGYDGHCLGLSQEAVADHLRDGLCHVVRLKVPEEGICTVTDAVRGDIEIPWAQVDMQVLLKSDGMPTYHLANVVDDHLMGVTHVIRGEEWLNSAPKHLLLYAAFGWAAPEFVHLALLRNPDRSKLSKRKNPTSILWYERMGFLPQGLLNYLALLTGGMAVPDGGEEMKSLETILSDFDLQEISQGGPIFDRTKLQWLNGRWIREGLDDAAFQDAVGTWGFQPERLAAIAALARTRATTLTDLPDLVGHFFRGSLGIDPEALKVLAADEEVLKECLHRCYESLGGIGDWTEANVHAAWTPIADYKELKLRKFLPPLYLALTGAKSGPPLFAALEILGRDVTRSRLKDALDSLGGASKKAAKRWDKAWAARSTAE